VFLTAYHFDGDPAKLMAASDRLLTVYPPSSVTMFVSIERDSGITVLDACESEEIASAFRTSREFHSSLAAVGLPSPRVEPLGAVHRAVMNRDD